MLRRRGRGRGDAPAGDARLAEGLRRGDPDALAEIHRVHGGLVLGYLRSALRDPGAAEDVHQEVFLDVWRRGRSYDPARASLGSWIMLIARSRAIDHLRRRVPEPRDIADDLRRDEDPATSPDLLVERWAVAGMLASLPVAEARVLRMRFHEGLTQTEIAERTGIPLGTVKTYMVRGLRRLREMMEAER
ncbi:MAG: sigma-70 family RNA polymerase sigma factor [Thermoleophilia bacterium]